MRGRVSTSVDFAGGGAAAMFRWATIAPAPMATTTTMKTCIPLWLANFMMPSPRINFGGSLDESPIPVLTASVAMIRIRREPRTRLEITAARVVGIERRGNLGMPRLQHGQDRRQDDERGAGCAEEAADHHPPERCALPAAFTEAQRHRYHPGQHRKTGHQDRTQTAPCAFYRRLRWLAALDPAALSKSHEQDGVCHGHADRHDRA